MHKDIEELPISAARSMRRAEGVPYSDSVAPKSAKALVGRINDGLKVGIGRRAAEDGAKARAFALSKGSERHHFFLDMDE